jgi:hypothetical protein
VYNNLLYKSEFGQAHCEEWSRGVEQNLFCNFWTFLQVSTNFGSLKQFLKFKIIENELKTPHSVGPQIGPRPAARGRKRPTHAAWRPAAHGEKWPRPAGQMARGASTTR